MENTKQALALATAKRQEILDCIRGIESSDQYNMAQLFKNEIFKFLEQRKEDNATEEFYEKVFEFFKTFGYYKNLTSIYAKLQKLQDDPTCLNFLVEEMYALFIKDTEVKEAFEPLADMIEQWLWVKNNFIQYS